MFVGPPVSNSKLAAIRLRIGARVTLT